VTADCHRQESDDNKIGGCGGGEGENGLVAKILWQRQMTEVDDGSGRRHNLDLGGRKQSPSASVASTTAIPNGERHDSESSRGGKMATAAAGAESDDLLGASAAVGGGGGNDDGRRGLTLTGKGQEPVQQQQQARADTDRQGARAGAAANNDGITWHNCYIKLDSIFC
jgi:hypothetical protein